MKTHIRNHEVPVEEVLPGMRRQILGYDTDLMLVRVTFDRDVIAPWHSHPHQQVSYIESGAFEVEIGDQKELLRAGDSFVIPSHIGHSAKCIEPGVIIDTFSPAREDFLKKS
ncbi:MAG: cupin domain-containing protein [candidate division KSB1 bacterium]|nr:cupin domain-containing protein [candidate division KSB1 bacterium]MDZ7333829.1 cupin domain-containing protein [candidate division KSB1 bacterium]MDZ7356072.1 cupin domain-containing protein [candidate division KSB1 bacterium]MDZ7377056.1 cupin domain-containing protein [candidate division KSB1 bacterium]MDZ7400589.1 cupin domain-containing protein [candidate division KSB1 bacterium]